MKKHKFQSLLILLTALFLIFTLVSCGADGGTKAELDGYYPEASDKNEMVEGMPPTGSTSDKPGSTGNFERKIIRKVTMSCETKSFDTATDHILDTLAHYGGYVEASSVNGTGYRDSDRGDSTRYATYTLRIPAENLDAYLDALRVGETIRVIKQTSGSHEITGTYYDIASRIATLETERDALRQMMAGFTDYSDIEAMLSVQERLYNVIEEIEALKTQLNIYDDQVDLSTIELSLNEVYTYTEAATPSFGERIGEAFAESWQNFASGCQNFAVNFISALPTILLLGVIAALAVILGLKAVRKYKRKRTPPTQDGN